MSTNRHSNPSKNRKRRVLNPRAAVILVCVAFALTTGVRKLHGRQFSKTVQFLRASAIESLEQQNYVSAVSLMNQYLSLRSSDIEIKESLSKLLAEQIGTVPALEQAFGMNEDLLRDSVPQPELRLRQAKLALRLKRFSDAKAHLNILQSALPDSAEVWMLSGQVAIELRQFDEAKRFLNTAIRCPDPDPAAFAALIDVSIQQNADHEDPDVSNGLLDQMIAANPTAAAFEQRAAWRISHDDTQGAIQDVWKGLERDPEHARLNALLVHCCQKLYDAQIPDWERSTAKAVQHFTALVKQTSQPRPILNLATILWISGEKQESVALLEDSIRQAPRAFILHRLLLEYLLNDGQAVKAKEVLARLPDSAFNQSDRAYLNGRILMADQKWLEAVDALNQSIAFAQKSSSTLPRARLALAIAQRHTGNRGSTMDMYRTVLTNNPQSVDGRLGIAATLVDANKTELAIAEYKQLIEVPGVAPYLASLMIEHNLRLPASLRRWDDVRKLLNDDSPAVTDEIQRALLKADLKLAMGEVTDAMHVLEIHAAKHPGSTELSRAMKRMNGELKSELQDRLQLVIKDNPANIEAHAALIRLYLASSQPELADQWVQDVTLNGRFPELQSPSAQLVMISALQIARQWELAAGRTTALSWLQEHAIAQSQSVAKQQPSLHSQLVRQLAIAGRTDEALAEIASVSERLPQVAAMSCLELVRFSEDRKLVQQSVQNRLTALIARSPANMALRTMYAEVLLYADRFEEAAQVLSQVTAYDETQTFAAARLAWIMAVTPSELPKQSLANTTEAQSQSSEPQSEATATAVELINKALQREPNVAMIHTLNHRIQLTQGLYSRIDDACRTDAGDEPLSTTAMVYWAAAVQQLGRPEEAASICRRIKDTIAQDPLLPADDRLLNTILEAISDPRTADIIR